nr:hypothetical protein [Methanobrevibacter arboriphilus]
MFQSKLFHGKNILYIKNHCKSNDFIFKISNDNFQINQREKDNMVLEDLTKNIKEISGTNKVPIDELMNKKFMTENTKFSNFDEMLEKSNLEEKYNTFEKINSSAEWNTFIQNNTNFNSWDDMKGKAAKSWAIKKIGL